MTTSYAPPGRVSYRVLAGVEISNNLDIPPQQCDWCGSVDATTTVRVHGDPSPDSLYPVDLADVCEACADHVVRRALDEQDTYSRKPIRVETTS